MPLQTLVYSAQLSQAGNETSVQNEFLSAKAVAPALLPWGCSLLTAAVRALNFSFCTGKKQYRPTQGSAVCVVQSQAMQTRDVQNAQCFAASHLP